MVATRDPDILHPVYLVTNRLRWALLAHAVVVNALRLDAVAHPVALWIACSVMTGWTAVMGLLLSRPARRTDRLMVVDVVVSALVLASSGWILGPETLQASHHEVPVYWFAAAPLVIAVGRGVGWGLAAGALLGGLRVFLHLHADDRVWAGLVVLGLAIWALGAVVDTLRASFDDRDSRNARLAVLAERDRLNRIVHDGALQVLALVEREGPELGPKGEQLARVARQQETLLRRLLQDRSVDLPGAESDRVDLAQMLEAHASDRVTVAVMAGEVPMAAARARELDAAVTEVLLNVAKHAGPEARAWVLLEEEDGEVTVSVRDNGVGMSKEQVEGAHTSGRMGINASVLGRIGDIGGIAVARSQLGRGVEWEFRIPLEGGQ
ncbi:MacS family sensor histidine kinase [Luteococcus sp. Sow4_B9]|uniref:MacS family sensor histidine kinase n=1 Tax=Luteococcus sp. Sow4_B9 TaxID=3438792 RepID=UPI003F9CAE30